MKAAQDWSFITKEPGLPKLKPQDNRIFHALTAAYSNGQQQEVFGASATIVQREKELCEMALEELRRVHQDGDKADPTLDLIKEHYQARLRIASEKENKLKALADDSRKLNEDHKKKTQELAEVKRNLMESQSKLRELAKQTEKLIKKEEELRFIEENLRKELGNNKREMLNGLYEIVVEMGGEAGGIAASASTVLPIDTVSEEAKPQSQRPEAASHEAAKPETTLAMPDRQSPPTLARDIPPVSAPALVRENPTLSASAPPKTPMVQPVQASPVTSSNPTVVLASLPTSPNGTLLQAPPLQKSNATTLEGLIDRAQRVKAFEPLKALFSRSLVKTSEGEAICEYFYPVQSSKENRHYVFNAPFTMLALLQVLQRDPTGFHSRIEMAAGDLLSRLDHGKGIGLEEALKGEFSREGLTQLLGLAWKPREAAFQEMAAKVIARLESLGAMRSKSLEDQFAKWVG